MSNFKNRIITISGDPSSGKSTVIEQLRKDFEDKGFKVSVYSIGNEFREMAKEKGLSVEEFNVYAEKRKSIDKMIDDQVAKRGEEINSKERPGQVFIFDSRLAWNNIPDSLSVRLTIDKNIAGQRAFNDPSRKFETLEEATMDTQTRKENEQARYKKRYGVDLQDVNNYRLVIDTSYSSVEDIAEVIEKCLELEMEDKDYGKTWTSPKKLLPQQSERETMGKGTYYTFDDLMDIIQKDGYDSSEEIDTVKCEDRLYIREGHHRNFVAAYLGKTLIPYKISSITTQKNVCLNNLRGHEMFFDKKGKDGKKIYFSYKEVYPDIYEEKTNSDDAR